MEAHTQHQRCPGNTQPPRRGGAWAVGSKGSDLPSSGTTGAKHLCLSEPCFSRYKALFTLLKENWNEFQQVTLQSKNNYNPNFKSICILHY